MAKETIIISPEMRANARAYTPSRKNDGASPSSKAPSRFLSPLRARSLSDFHWEFSESDMGAKAAYRALKERLASQSDKAASTYLLSSKSYFIFSNEHYGSKGAALEEMVLCNMRCLKPRAVGCLIVSDTEYLFFWTAN